jgi:ABC-2 type transport system ATP-binding protein
VIKYARRTEEQERVVSDTAIVAEGLVKRYGEVTALDGVDLCVPAGAIYAMLGPNGAGKTTTIGILTTLLQPTAGTARVAGADVARQPEAVRRAIGVTFQDIVLDRDLTGRQVLDVHGKLYRMPGPDRRRRIDELVQLVRLEDAIDRRVKTYSGGMQRRLELARGLMTDPQVLFLDEPTQGLDPQNRVAIWEYVRALRAERGLTLLLTTHAMDEAEALADVVGIVDRGRKVAEGAPAALAAELGADVIRLVGGGHGAALADELRALAFVDHVAASPDDRLIEVGVDSGPRRLAEVVARATGHGFAIDDITVARPSLGDMFLQYTGRALRD